MKLHNAVLAALLAACGSSAGTGGKDAGADLDSGPDAATGPMFMRGPGPRAEAATVFDPATGKLLVYGGDQGTVEAQMPIPDIIGETWLLDTSTGAWHQVTSPGPSARARTVAVYDSTGKRALVFGGRFKPKGALVAYTLFFDTWAFDFQAETWTKLPASNTPSGRSLAAGAYDAASNSLVIYGGNASTSGVTYSPINDLQMLDLGSNAWTAVTTSGAPAPRIFTSYAFDEGRRRLILYSGKTGLLSPPSLKETWSYDVSAARFQLLGTSQGPTARFGGALIYDMARDRMLLFGGHQDDPNGVGDIANDLWALGLADGAWLKIRQGDTITGNQCIVNGSLVEPLGVDYAVPDLGAPERRFTHGVAVDVAKGRAILFGGASDCAKLDDAWILDLATTDGMWQRALKATQGEGCTRRADQCACYCN